MIKELVKIANELDELGLTEEADELDGVIRDNSHNAGAEPTTSEANSWTDKIDQFITDSLSEDSVVFIPGEGEGLLGAITSNDSIDLREYVLEVLPDKIAELSESLGMDPQELLHTIIDRAKANPLYAQEEDTDFAYIIDAVNFYLNNYIF